MNTTMLLRVAVIIFHCASQSALAQTAATPTFRPNGGDFTNSISVQITSDTVDSIIYYTTNGTTPTERSPSITNGGSIDLRSSTIINAIARRTGDAGSAVAASKGYFHYRVSGNQHYFYGNWPDPLFDDKMNALKRTPPYNSGEQHFNFFTNTVIETKGAHKGFKVLSDWKFHGNGATLKLSKNIPEDSPGRISAHVFGVHNATRNGLVNFVVIEGFNIDCNHDELKQRTGMLKLRGIHLIGTHNEVRDCTVRQPIGWYGALKDVSEVFAIDLRAQYSNSWGNIVSNCVVKDYRGGANSWVNGIAMSAEDGVTLTGKVQNCKVYGNGNDNDYGYNAQGAVSVVYDGNESHGMNRGFNNDTGEGFGIRWLNSKFYIPARGKGMYIIASKNGYAAFNSFYLEGDNSSGIALSGPVGPQPGASNWVFEANWIGRRGGNHKNCRGVVFGPFPWSRYSYTAPSRISLYNNQIGSAITSMVKNGKNCVFSGNRVIGRRDVLPSGFAETSPK